MADDITTSKWLLGGGLISIGAGARWLIEWWGKRDLRKQQRADRVAGEESKKVQALTTRLDTLEDKMGRITLAMNILVAKEFRREPNSPELQQVHAILGDAFPLHLHVPQDMTDKLRGI